MSKETSLKKSDDKTTVKIKKQPIKTNIPDFSNKQAEKPPKRVVKKRMMVSKTPIGKNSKQGKLF